MSMTLILLGVSSIYIGTLLFFRKRYDEDIQELNEQLKNLKQELYESTNKRIKLEVQYDLLKNTVDAPVKNNNFTEKKVVKKRGRRPGWNNNK